MTRPPCKAPGCPQEAHIFDPEGDWCDAHWDEAEKARNDAFKVKTAEAGGPWSQLCPRRGETSPVPPSGQREEYLPDLWEIRTQMHLGLVARHCSWCGSLHPDDFMERVEQGWVVGPTDKTYKAYLSQAEGADMGRTETKFYFQHLSDEQRNRFIELYNNALTKPEPIEPYMHIGYPGAFYNLPYFCRAMND